MKLRNLIGLISLCLASVPAIAADYTTRKFDNDAVWYRFETPIPVAFHMPASGQITYADYVLLLPDQDARNDVALIRESLTEAHRLATPICDQAGTACKKTYNASFVGVLEGSETVSTGTVSESNRLLSGLFTVRKFSAFSLHAVNGRGPIFEVSFNESDLREKMLALTISERAIVK